MGDSAGGVGGRGVCGGGGGEGEKGVRSYGGVEKGG